MAMPNFDFRQIAKPQGTGLYSGAGRYSQVSANGQGRPQQGGGIYNQANYTLSPAAKWMQQNREQLTGERKFDDHITTTANRYMNGGMDPRQAVERSKGEMNPAIDYQNEWYKKEMAGGNSLFDKIMNGLVVAGASAFGGPVAGAFAGSTFGNTGGGVLGSLKGAAGGAISGGALDGLAGGAANWLAPSGGAWNGIAGAGLKGAVKQGVKAIPNNRSRNVLSP